MESLLSTKYLFIGGPADGKIIAANAPYHSVAEPSPMKATDYAIDYSYAPADIVHTYVRVAYGFGANNKRYVYLQKDNDENRKRIEDLMARLFDTYIEVNS